jgi:CheY-like chemotaxis protein
VLDPKATVLVIDDSQIVLDVVRSRLERRGYRVVTLDSPLGAARAMLRDKPDVVLMDLEMPALSGDRAASVLQRSVTDAAPIVLHTSRTEEEVASRAVACHAAGYIRKTEDEAEFIAKFEYILTRVRTHRRAKT